MNSTILRRFSHLLPVFLLAVSENQIRAQTPGEKLPGMSLEIVVRDAKELGVTAPEGKKVAVIDQSPVEDNPNFSMSQDHHNGALKLNQTQLGDGLKIKGKLYVPADAKVVPQSLRVTLRSQTKLGMEILAEANLSLKETSNTWMDFELALPAKPDHGPDTGKFLLMFSASPLAGPMYLDDLHVFDSQGNELWDSPGFE